MKKNKEKCRSNSIIINKKNKHKKQETEKGTDRKTKNEH